MENLTIKLDTQNECTLFLSDTQILFHDVLIAKEPWPMMAFELHIFLDSASFKTPQSIAELQELEMPNTLEQSQQEALRDALIESKINGEYLVDHIETLEMSDVFSKEENESIKHLYLHGGFMNIVKENPLYSILHWVGEIYRIGDYYLCSVANAAEVKDKKNFEYGFDVHYMDTDRTYSGIRKKLCNFFREYYLSHIAIIK